MPSFPPTGFRTFTTEENRIDGAPRSSAAARGYRSWARTSHREDLARLLVRERVDRSDDPYDDETFERLSSIVQAAVLTLAARYVVTHDTVLAVGFTDAEEMMRSPFSSDSRLIICRTCGRDIWGHPAYDRCYICRRKRP